MTKPGRRATIGTEIRILDPAGNVTGIVATTINYNSEGHRRLSFAGTPNILQELDTLGEVPLPPYIKRSTREAADADRYQTVYAARQGSLAAPTAGLHFTPQLLTRIQARGVDLAEVTLHVGLGTFAPVKVDDVRNHHMHEERYAVTPANADRINTARSQRRRIVAVGTTTLRVLESIARQNDGQVIAGAGRTTIFIYPPSSFCAVDALITNFHLPRSTLLMLTSAFASPGSVRGRDLMLQAYAAAIRERYRFFSYGDAMLIQ